MDLRELRKKTGLSVSYVAKNVSRKIHTVEKYETYHRLPSVDILIKLADLYDVDYNVIIESYKHHKKMMNNINGLKNEKKKNLQTV